jgi:hypothetical protein
MPKYSRIAPAGAERRSVVFGGLELGKRRATACPSPRRPWGVSRRVGSAQSKIPGCARNDSSPGQTETDSLIS